MKSYPDIGTPTPNELAAYFDGELPADRCVRVEEWLDQHPELAAELEAHQDVTSLFQAAPPPEPTSEEWDVALSRIESGLASSANAPPMIGTALDTKARRSSKRSWLAWTAAVAAGIVIALANVNDPRPRHVEAIEPYPITTANDVDILSVHGKDLGMLVVGAGPLQEPLALATVHDVTVENVQPAEDGMMPQVGVSPADAASPMIVAPLGGAPQEQKAP